MQQFEPFDDCAICQAMRRAEQEGRTLGESELLRAFREQEQSGVGVVGFSEDFKK